MLCILVECEECLYTTLCFAIGSSFHHQVPTCTRTPYTGGHSDAATHCLLTSPWTTCARGSEKKGTCTAFFPKRSKVLSQPPAPLCSPMLSALPCRGLYELPTVSSALRTVSAYCRHLDTLPFFTDPRERLASTLCSALHCAVLYHDTVRLLCSSRQSPIAIWTLCFLFIVHTKDTETLV